MEEVSGSPGSQVQFRSFVFRRTRETWHGSRASLHVSLLMTSELWKEYTHRLVDLRGGVTRKKENQKVIFYIPEFQTFHTVYLFFDNQFGILKFIICILVIFYSIYIASKIYLFINRLLTVILYFFEQFFKRFGFLYFTYIVYKIRFI